MCVWLPGPGAYHRGSFSSPEIFSQDCRLQCGDRCLEVLLSDDGGEVFLTAAKFGFSWKIRGFRKIRVGRFFVKISGRISEKNVSDLPDGLVSY